VNPLAELKCESRANTLPFQATPTFAEQSVSGVDAFQATLPLPIIERLSAPTKHTNDPAVAQTCSAPADMCVG
jgi:hypothetical protein